jgi:hypothetical protein
MTNETITTRSTVISALFAAAIFSAYWAYTIIDDLVRVFTKEVTYIDLGVIFVLGLICGAGLGLAFALRSRKDA